MGVLLLTASMLGCLDTWAPEHYYLTIITFSKQCWSSQSVMGNIGLEIDTQFYLHSNVSWGVNDKT